MTGWLFGAAVCCWLLAAAGSGQEAPPAAERKHLGDAAAESVKIEREKTLSNNARVAKAYNEEDDTSSNLWNMRRWKQAVKKSEDPVLSDHLRRWMYLHHIPANYLDPDVAPTAYVPFSRGVYLDPIPGVGSGSITGASGITEFSPELALNEHRRLLHEFSSSPFNYIMWLRRALAANPSTAAVANAVGAGAEALDPYHFQPTQYLPSGWGLAAQGLRNKVALATTTALASGIPTPASYRTFDQQVAPFSQMDPFSSKLSSIYPWSPTLMASGGAPNQPQPMAEQGGNTAVSFLQAASSAHPTRHQSGVASTMGVAAGKSAGARPSGAEAMRFARARHRARSAGTAQQHLSASSHDDEGPTGVDSALPGHPTTRLRPFQTGLLPSSFSRPMEDLAKGPFSFMTPPASITSDPRTNTAFGGWSAFDPATHAPMGVPIYPPNPNNPLVAGGAPPRSDAIGSPPVSVYRGDVIAAMQDVATTGSKSSKSSKSSTSMSRGTSSVDMPPPQLLMPQMYPQLYTEREHLVQQGAFNPAAQQRGAQGTGGIGTPAHEHGSDSGSDDDAGEGDNDDDGSDGGDADTTESNQDGASSGDADRPGGMVGVPPPMSGGLVPGGGDGGASLSTIPGPLTSSDSAPQGIHLAPPHPSGGYLSSTFFTRLDHPDSGLRSSLNGYRASYRDLHKALVGKDATEEDVRRFAPEEASYDDGFAGRVTGLERAAGVAREHQIRPVLTGIGYHHGAGGIGLQHGHMMSPAMMGAHGHPGLAGYGTGSSAHSQRFPHRGGGGGGGGVSELQESLNTLNSAVQAIAETQKSLAQEVEASHSSRNGCGCTGCSCDGEGDEDERDEDREDEEEPIDDDGGTGSGGTDDDDGGDAGSGSSEADGDFADSGSSEDGGNFADSGSSADEDALDTDRGSGMSGGAEAMRFRELRGTSGWAQHHALHRSQSIPERIHNGHSGRHEHEQSDFDDSEIADGHLRHQVGTIHHRVHAGIEASRRHVHRAVHHHLDKFVDGDSDSEGDSEGDAYGSFDQPEPQNKLMPRVKSHLPRLPGKLAFDGDADSTGFDSTNQEVGDMAAGAEGDFARHDSYRNSEHQGRTVADDHHAWDAAKHGRELSRTLPDAAGAHDWADSDLPSPAAPRLQSDPADMLVLDPTVDVLTDEEKAEKMEAMVKARHSTTFRFRGSAKAKAKAKARGRAASRAAGAGGGGSRAPLADAPRFAQSRAQARHAALARRGASIANPVFEDDRVAASLAASTTESLAESPFAMRGDDVVARHELGAGAPAVLPQQHLLEIRQRISGRTDGDNDGSHANDALKANLARFLSRRRQASSASPLDAASAADDEDRILRSIRDAAKHAVQSGPDLFLQTHASRAGAAQAPLAPGPAATAAPAASGAAPATSVSPSPSMAARNRAAIMAARAKEARAHASAAPSQSPHPSPTPSSHVLPQPQTAEREADRFAESGAEADADAEAFGVSAARERIAMGVGTDKDVEDVRKADEEAMVSASLQRKGDPIYSSTKAKKPAMTTPAPTPPPKLQKLELASLKDMRDTKELANALLFEETPRAPAAEPKKRAHFIKHVFAPGTAPEDAEESTDLVRNLAHGAKELFSEDMEEEVSPQAPPPDPLPMMDAKDAMEAAQGEGGRRVSDPAPSADYSLPMPEDDPWHPSASKAMKRVLRDMYGIAVGGLSEPIEQLMGPGAGNARKFINLRDMMNGPFGDTSSVIGEEYNKRVLNKLLKEQEEAEEE